MQVILWLGKSLLILAIFHLVVPPVVNSLTRNSWVKLPVMLLFAFVAAVFMAWLDYVPYIIFFIWLALTYYTLQVMTEAKFEHEADMRMNKPVFYISSYSYVVMACVLAWLFQVEIVTGDSAGPGMPVWRYMIGLK